MHLTTEEFFVDHDEEMAKPPVKVRVIPMVAPRVPKRKPARWVVIASPLDSKLGEPYPVKTFSIDAEHSRESQRDEAYAFAETYRSAHDERTDVVYYGGSQK